MNGDYLLDTNVFINAINRQLRLPPARYLFSVITELELLSFPDLKPADEERIRSILGQLTCVEIDEFVKKEAIDFRQRTGTKLPDSIIAASAMVAGATLVTDDNKLSERHCGDVVGLNSLVSR